MSTLLKKVFCTPVCVFIFNKGMNYTSELFDLDAIQFSVFGKTYIQILAGYSDLF